MAWTHATLTRALQDWPEDDNTEFTDNIDTIIRLGEDRVLRDLPLTLFDRTRSGTFVAGQMLQDKPDSMLALIDLFVTIQSNRIRLKARTTSFVLSFWPTPSVTDEPEYVADADDDNWYVAPTPDAPYSWDALIIERPDPMSASNTETWLGTNLSDLLFHACLLQAELFIKEDSTDQGRLAWVNKHYKEDLLPGAMVQFQNHLRRPHP